MRARSGEIGWRSAVHELRTRDPGALGAAASLDERRRFLRHLRPWWDVHRHKIAPAVGATIEAMQAEARLAVAAGKLVSAERRRTAARWSASGRAAATAVETLRVARIVNCTGPEIDIVRAGEPLLDALLAAGRIRPDPLAHRHRRRRRVPGDRRRRRGRARRLSAIGPVTRGTFWESVAVPDIRGAGRAGRGAADRLTFRREWPGRSAQITIRNSAPPPSRVADADRAAMGEHDLAGEAEADAGAFALGGEEGQEDVLPQPLGHAGAVVGDLDLGAAGAGARRSDSQTCGRLGMAARRLGGIADQVDQHLAHQIGIGVERQRLVRRRG